MICARGFYFYGSTPPIFFFCPNDGSLIFEMELFADIHTLLNVYACGIFHFAKCQSATLSERMAVWDFFFFSRGAQLCFKGNVALMNIPFPHEITSCNNTAPLPKDILLQTVYTLPLARTHAHTHLYTLVHTSSVTRARTLLSAPSHVPTHANPGGLFIY